MQLVEHHRIDRHDPRFAAIDAAAFASKRRYNAALYLTRQAFIHHRQVLSYEELARDMQTSVEYRALLAKVTVLPGLAPFLVNGRPLKAMNQWYNQRRAHLQAKLPDDVCSSRQFDILTDQRGRQITDYLHVVSRRVVDQLVARHVGTLVIGKNDGWKQVITLGKRTNQNFVFVPHARFIALLQYKAELVGIRVVVSEERYTSKCSYLDLEPVGKRELYASKRVKRGLSRASDGRRLNADINGAYNILRKGVPDALGNGIGGGSSPG